MTRTQYANALVDGAKHYNAHAVRYDFVGQQETHFNSNSFVSSLIVAKGGESDLADVRNIAAQMDSGPLNVYGQRPVLDDGAMSERVRIDLHAHKAIATGFANAGIEPARFESSPLAAATPPPRIQNAINAASSLVPAAKEATQQLGGWLLKHLESPPLR